ncbi:hypothetical protein pipiens_005855 [Culex pipiens pipiens]|uniref:CUB domain-containing protein n=1 Tax=Culex pipiens pipiens TaxID=38569 RepID=A0ABD1DT61_CULPP
MGCYRYDETLYIESPNYSGYFRANTNCRWRLTAPTNYLLYLNCYDVILAKFVLLK